MWVKRTSKAIPDHGCWVAGILLVTLFGTALAADLVDREAAYYQIVTLPMPVGIILEVGAIEPLPGKKVAVSTRLGDIYILDGAMENPPVDVKYSLFASGLHEVLGLAWRDGCLYATQRCEVTRIKDLDGDGRADVFETFCDAWGITGDYHEYAFGSKFDRDGFLWIVLCLTGSFTSETEFRGWGLKIGPDGKAAPVCSGIRSPGGIGMDSEGNVFYTDNQGPWNGACSLKHLKPGAFLGNPSGNRWYELAPGMGKRPADPKSLSRMNVEAKRIPELVPPAVMFPYNRMGQSASGIACDLSEGRFGPFRKQLFVGDQTHSTVMRVFLETVKGRFQGACFPFKEGFASGNLSLQFGQDSSLFVGGTDRGWGARGGKPFALQRLVWNGKTPFEIHEMRAKSDGFELTFTQEVDAVACAVPEAYQMDTFTYIYRADYGSPEVDSTHAKITMASVSPDKKSVRLVVDGLVEGHIHELRLPGVKSSSGEPLLHPLAYYTMNSIP